MMMIGVKRKGMASNESKEEEEGRSKDRRQVPRKQFL